MRKVILTVILSLLFFVSSAYAETTLSILKIKSTDDKKVELFVSAVDEMGKPLKGLANKDFTLNIGGEEVKSFDLKPTTTSQEPKSIMMAVDVSGSMQGQPFIQTKKAMSILLDQLDNNDYISLMSFGSNVNFASQFIKQKYKIREKIESLQPNEEWTHLYEAVYKAIEKCKNESLTTRTAIIILTDGKDEGSKEIFRSKSIELAQNASIPVFTLGIGNKIDKNYLEQVATASDGYFLSTYNANEIPALYNKILDQLNNQYLITFDLTKDPGDYKLNLMLNHNGETSNTNKKFIFKPEVNQSTSINGINYLFIGSLLIAFLIALAVIFYFIKNKKSDNTDTKKTWLEFPDGDCPTMGFGVDAYNSGDTILANPSLDIFLEVSGLENSIIPLFKKKEMIIDSLVIARYGKENKKKNDKVYLWTKKVAVSRFSDNKPNGHGEIYFNKEIDRFVIKDYNSTNGTLINSNKIEANKDQPLQDGDNIDVGGLGGIRIIYREINS